MKAGHLATALLAVALGPLVLAGCSSSANEENIKGSAPYVPHTEGTPDFKTQAEYELYRTEKARKERPAGKAAGKAKAKSGSAARVH